MALAFYAVGAMLIAAPLPLHFASTVARAVRPDVWLNLWALTWTSEHLFAAGSLFDANIFFPHLNTLAYSDHFIGQALISGPWYWLTGSPQIGYNVAWYAALVLTAWGGYLWVRSLIGEQPGGEAAALVAGAVCLFVPGKRTALSHLQVMSLQGVTFSMLAMHALMKRPGWLPALGLTGALLYGALSSWYTAAYLAILLPVLGLAGLYFVEPEAPRIRVAGWGALSMAVVALLMFPVAAPFRAVQQELQFTRPVSELVETSLRPIDFVSSWSWLHEGWMPSGSGAGGYFPGFVAVFLGAVGLWVSRRRGERWPLIYGVVAAGFVVLSLGPSLPLPGGGGVPMPYALLYNFVPGFGALRNPYRAAFIASLLFAVPVGYGARYFIEACRGRLLIGQRWRARPRIGRLAPVTWTVAVSLAGLHLFEAWPGPQQIAPLPEPPSTVYEWMAGQEERPATLVWPLPRPFDDNARYQLWTVGGWTPLINGHSGLYPGDFAALYEVDAEFPEREFLAALKEQFPVEMIVAHFGLASDGAERRELASLSRELEEVWAEGDDVAYRIGNGANAGWLRRRLPVRLLGEELAVRTTPGAAGCDLRVAIDGAVVADRALAASEDEVSREGASPAPGDRAEVSYTVAVDLAGVHPGSGLESAAMRARERGFATVEIFLSRPQAGVRVDLRASVDEESGARVEVNGWRLQSAPVVAVLISAATGRVSAWRAAEAEQEDAAAALQELLALGQAGDRLGVAIVEEFDSTLIERLRLLLDAAGAAGSEVDLDDRGAAYVFMGAIGAPTGSADEVLERTSAELTGGERGGDCRLAPIVEFSWLPVRTER